MVYGFLRPLASIAIRVYFKKIYLDNAEGIPKDKPVFIASNHPTAFIEPCVLACLLPNSLNFLVRGNLWGNPFYEKLMAGMHLIPIHRPSDGDPEMMNKNQDTFRYCHEALAQNKTMLIMPEGSTKQILQLRRLKKGLARICFGAIDKYPDLDIYIIPVGSNFTQANRPRNELRIKVGKPIRALDFWKESRDQPNRGIRLLTQKVFEGMKETVIHVEEEADFELGHQLLKVERNQEKKSIFPIFKKDRQPLQRELEIAEKINSLDESQKENWKEVTNAYFTKVEKNGLKEGFQIKRNGFLNYLFLLLGAMPGLIGAIFHFPIVGFANFIKKTKVTQLEFEQPIFLGINIVGMFFYYMIWVVFGFFVKKWVYWIGLILMPIFGFLFLSLKDLWNDIKNNNRFEKLSEPERVGLLDMRNAVLNLINN